MLFILDGMHGNLARWLRISGYDVIYFRDKDDDELIREALASNRVLLTRDLSLEKRAKKASVITLLMEGEKVRDHLAQIKKVLSLEVNPDESRCPICNGELTKKTREEVRFKVQESSLNAFDDFRICKTCDKVYWKGSHWEKISKVLADV
jgi:uncharacterized protein with PIN domain